MRYGWPYVELQMEPGSFSLGQGFFRPRIQVTCGAGHSRSESGQARRPSSGRIKKRLTNLNQRESRQPTQSLRLSSTQIERGWARDTSAPLSKPHRLGVPSGSDGIATQTAGCLSVFESQARVARRDYALYPCSGLPLE